MAGTASQWDFILMPGMDGTGLLFEPLTRVLPDSVRYRIVRYPGDRPTPYAGLLEMVNRAAAASERPVVLVAESFSGPLALSYSASCRANVRAVILSASFVTSPVPACVRWIAKDPLFRMPVPRCVTRHLLLDRDSPASLIEAVDHARRQVSPCVVADRLRQVCDVNCRQGLVDCPAPILYLQAERDRLVGKQCAEEIKRVRPDVTIRSLPGPHLLLQTRPREAWVEIERFVREQQTTQPKQEE